MTERVPCKSEDCNHTILPTTALDTGGFCMPCVQKKANEEYKKYVEENKRTINPYDGVTKPIDIIKIYHKSQKRDPLIEYVKYPFPIETVYESLNHQQIQDLIEYCLYLFKNEANDMAEEIISCLVSFLNADISIILKWLVESNIFYPSYYFKSANLTIQNTLLKKMEGVVNDEDHSHEEYHIICALAWIESKEVNAFFAENPKIRKYTQQAGWEIDKNGNRRNLFHNECYPLIKNKQHITHEKHNFFEIEKNTCGWCGNPLTCLFSLSSDDSRFDFLKSDQHNFRISTCLNCSCYVDPFFTTQIQNSAVHDSQSSGDVSGISDFIVSRADDIISFEPNSLIIAPIARSTFHATNIFASITFSQIGGYPTWIQHAYYPSCPKCQQTMMFEGQIALEDFEEYGEGIYYAFYCVPCKVAATSYQQT
jgi:hypothetical protein